MKVFYLGVDVSKKKLDLCLRSNGKDILYDVIPNDLSSIKSWLTRTFEKFFLSEDSLVVCAEHTGQYTYPLVCATKSIHLRGLIPSAIFCAISAASALSLSLTSTSEYACEPIIGSDTIAASSFFTSSIVRPV